MKIEYYKELYQERLAIMIIDGGLKEEVAKAKALKEIKNLFFSRNGADKAKTYHDLIMLEKLIKTL